MPIQKTGSGQFVITPAGNNPRNIHITLTGVDEKNYQPVEAPLQVSALPARYPDAPNGAAINWLTNFSFRKLGQGKTPSFTIVMPKYKGSAYVYYDDVKRQLVLLGQATEDGGTISFNLTLSDPSVGMT